MSTTNSTLEFVKYRQVSTERRTRAACEILRFFMEGRHPLKPCFEVWLVVPGREYLETATHARLPPEHL